MELQLKVFSAKDTHDQGTLHFTHYRCALLSETSSPSSEHAVGLEEQEKGVLRAHRRVAISFDCFL